MPVLHSLILLAALSRPFAEERLLLDRQLDSLRRILPDGATPEADLALITDLARAHLADPEIHVRAPLENGDRGTVAIEVKGQARFSGIDRFFRQVAQSPRLVDVESLTLDASDLDLVRVATVLRLPYRPRDAGLPPTPESARSRKDIPRGQAAAFGRDQALALAKTIDIAALRRARRNPRLFLSEIAAVVRDRPVVLTHARLTDEFTLGGLVLGDASLVGLESRIERGFFRIDDFLVVSRGACHRFEARGRSPIVGSEAEIPLPTEDPFQRDESPCRVDRDAGPATLLRGPGGKLPGKGPLSLHLREVDTADVFYALHELTGRGFVVDGDVRGRLSIEWDRVSLEDALAILQKAGLKIADAGGLIRVSRQPVEARSPGAEGGSRGAFTLKRADLRELLGVFGEADPGLVSFAPSGGLGQISVWARDVNLSELRQAVLAAAGLDDRVEDEHHVVGKGDAQLITRPAGAGRLVVRPHELSLSEFALSGLMSAGDGWAALAYSPTGALHVYRAGGRLADATVTAVFGNEIQLDTDDGGLRLGLPVLR